MAHFTKEELDSYRHSCMSVFGRINCAVHLRECPQCAALIKELEEEDSLINDLRESVQLYKDLSPGPAKDQSQ